MAVPQALHKLAVGEAICDEPWPVLLVEAQLLDAQALQALPAGRVHDWVILTQSHAQVGCFLIEKRCGQGVPKLILRAGKRQAGQCC